MADTILGTLTIAQAPRPDVTPILDRYVPTSVKRIHRGLLDDLSRDEIARAYAAKAGEAVLVTRLSDGSSVQLSAQKVHSALQGRLDALEADGCNIVLLLCTGAFGGLSLQVAFRLCVGAPKRCCSTASDSSKRIAGNWRTRLAF